MIAKIFGKQQTALGPYLGWSEFKLPMLNIIESMYICCTITLQRAQFSAPLNLLFCELKTDFPLPLLQCALHDPI